MEWNGFDALKTYVEERVSEFALIPAERKNDLSALAADIRDRLNLEDHASLIFICTHNSRRSHLGHLWGQLSSSFYQAEGVACFSGGTEATAFNPRAVKALEEAGMQLTRLDESSNPLYQVSFSEHQEPISVFSKKYSDPPNPVHGFIAVMTCSDADEGCPIVLGAISRHAITFQDPKDFDGTPEESAHYAERCRQIAREMLYLFSRI